MKTITINDIRGYVPCYDPIKFIPEDWQGTALDVLMLDAVPVLDRLWVVLRTDLISERCMRLFAVWCARQCLRPEHDSRIKACIDVAERFANNEASEEERCAARSIAGLSRWATPMLPAESSAWSAAWLALESAAESATWLDAEFYEESAIKSVTRSAAWLAARLAAESSMESSQSSQLTKLTEMIKAENK